MRVQRTFRFVTAPGREHDVMDLHGAPQISVGGLVMTADLLSQQLVLPGRAAQA
ncbi:hypothetical protein HD593_006354 [Nonomuraea rubra]|uniref:Uncharacterized protein n=1 Tax=Nonomuraea rubra TaxID=46180 RepID=A0A7X0NXQ4_9ACTN|nr:hypothetical protein [Nonomuraea rubra]